MALKHTRSLNLFLLAVLVALSANVTSVLATSSGPSQCVTFDANWNLLAFNFNGKDYNAGTQDAFSSTSSATDITSQSNRPPFDVSSSSPLCFLSQFTNSIYVLNADASDHSLVYIYDATAKSWSAQKTSSPPSSYDPSTFGAILDHDTNVFYALSGGEMLSLDMALLKAATNEVIPWVDVQKPDLTTASNGDGGSGAGSSYQPVMALAQNHIHFLGVPGLDAGDAKIFVIHFSFLQPDPQSYGSFPNTHGRTASFFKDSGVQTEFAFIPDDGSAAYVLNVVTNTTRTLSGPKAKDPFAMYTASTTALVQLSSTGGSVQWIGYDPSSGSGTSWQTLSSIPSVNLSPSSSGSSGSSTSSSKGNSTVTTSSSKSTATGSTSNTSGAVRLSVGMIGGAALGIFGLAIGLGLGL